jgi:protein-tyrosine phosphatase
VLTRICDFILSFKDSGDSRSTEPSNVILHCDRGVSRSATAIIAYLMRTHRWDFDSALAFVGEKRRIKPNENFKEQLRVWEKVGYEIWENEQERTPKPEYAAFLMQRAERLQTLGLTGNEPVEIESL